MFKDKKVVVTGGSGFIGTHYIEELLSRGAQVITHTYKNTLKIQDERIEVVDDIDLETLDGAEYSYREQNEGGASNLNSYGSLRASLQVTGRDTESPDLPSEVSYQKVNIESPTGLYLFFILSINELNY